MKMYSFLIIIVLMLASCTPTIQHEITLTFPLKEIVAQARERSLPLAWIHAGNRNPGTGFSTSLGPEQGKVTFEHLPPPGRKT